MVKYFFIHGAWSSPACFSYLNEKLKPKYDTSFACYDCQTQRMPEIIDQTAEHLHGIYHPGDEIVVVGHSLGGLVALALEKEPYVSSVVTIASPLNGIRINRFALEFLAYRAPIIRHLATESSFLTKLQGDEYTKPMSQIVATKGFNPMISEPNDGVLTIHSQDGWMPPTARLTYVEATHFDVLQHGDTVNELAKVGENLRGK